ncbi:hypothetical protein TELCIR_04276 [Teladorsagia circumcincta]|uniref:RNA-directed DNA polymerase n=1 Tax=Teladorsagia circumcincta TaxID=45464 RepID=A0A2G9UU37_TELCI|nr:hypothetical protein TELCIR_04276 [Teladorsagia circumcincta]
MPEDIFASLNGGTIFSQIDLSDAYLQLELSEESKKKVVINTHKGLFRYNRLPFGIKTAPAIFQQVMNKMVTGLQGVAAYLDHILVSGRTEQEHKENLLAVFGRIADYGFKVRLDKCTFCRPEIQYLGFILDKNGRRLNPEKIDAIKNMDEPKNIAQLRSFLGMITYYSAFVPTMRNLRGPLDALLKKDVKWRWTSKEQEAFEDLKKALTSDVNLAHYDPHQKIIVAADACDYGIGCVISHRYATELYGWSYVYWPKLDKDCEEIVRSCSRCQEYAKNPIKAPLEAWSTPTGVWQRIHVDFVGPVCGSFYMVVVDASSKWPEIIEMTSISASQTVKEEEDVCKIWNPAKYRERQWNPIHIGTIQEDVRRRRNSTHAPAPGRQAHEAEVPLRRSKRIRRPVQRYPNTFR